MTMVDGVWAARLTKHSGVDIKHKGDILSYLVISSGLLQ